MTMAPATDRARPSDGAELLDGTAPARPHSRADPSPSPLTIVRWLVALIFAGAGSAKLAGVPAAVTLFAAVGFGQWFRIAIGSAEIIGAVLLLRRPTALPTALALSLVMIGAAGTEVVVLHRPPLSSGAMLVTLLVVAWSVRR